MHIQLYLRHYPADGKARYVGTTKAVHGLAAGLAECGARVSVLCEGASDSVCATSHGYDIRCFAACGGYRSFAVSPRLREHLASSAAAGPALLVLNGIFSPAVYAGARAAQAAGVPYVIAPHGSYDPTIFRRKPYLKWPYWYLFERGSLRRAAGLQLLDGRHRVWAQRRGVHTPVVEVPNGLSPEDRCPDDEMTWRRRGTMRVLYWGRMHTQQKGLDLLLQAAAMLQRRRVPLELTLQGPDWHGERRRLMALAARLGVNGAVRFLPGDFATPPPRVMAAYDAVCMPSRYEGFGLSALEAMIAGRPLLVSDRAGVAPHVRRAGAGVVVEARADAVAEGLEALLIRRPAWPAMGRNGCEYAVTHLNWRAIAQAALGDYLSLVHRWNARPNCY